jgi:hypothetical protein
MMTMKYLKFEWTSDFSYLKDGFIQSEWQWIQIRSDSLRSRYEEPAILSKNAHMKPAP